MIYLSYNAVMAFAFQQYVSHATFMAARSYQAGWDNPQTQEARARETLAQYLPGLASGEVRLGSSSIRARNVSFDVPPGDPAAVSTGFGKPVDTGIRVRVQFSMPLVALPLGDGDWDAVKTIDLEASSFLGREPTRAECANYFGELLQQLIIPGAPTYHSSAMTDNRTIVAMSDNGC